MKTIKPKPVRRTIEVKASRSKAFDVFTRKFDAWWPKSHHIGKAPIAAAVIEPRAGGRWYERGEDGSECEWGYVIAWNPPDGLTLAWQIDASFKYDAGLLTEVEVRFIELSPALTRVELEHRLLERYGERAESVRERIGHDRGWTAILRSFGAAAEA
jgi:hypothetical protein